MRFTSSPTLAGGKSGMRKVLLFALLLLAGLALSQSLPHVAPGPFAAASPFLRFLTMAGLAFIMIRVGHEFTLDKRNLRSYGRDYGVAMTAAALPWILVTLYFLFVLLPDGAVMRWDAWRESLLAGRFAAPTSAGVLFAMLAAAGLAATWTFRKARVLAVFDDIDTILLMVPLQMMLVGLAWQLGVVVLFLGGLLWVGWKWLHALPIPSSWGWILTYAVALAGFSEIVYVLTKAVDPALPVHLEVLLPAFVLGCVMERDFKGESHRDEHAATIVAGAFMVLVGLSLPPVVGAVVGQAGTFTAAQEFPGWGVLTMHVLALTALCNLGKMWPLFCYRKEASLRERLALSVAMWPRGEVGAGVLVVSLGYGIGGPVLTAAMLSLALNLVLTGAFILLVKRLLEPARPVARAASSREAPHLGPSWE